MDSFKDLVRHRRDSQIAGLYDLQETLGRGHFAIVKLAQHNFTGEKVAVKVIDKSKLDVISREHLYQEVRCMKLVQHSNIVRLYEVIDTASKLYLIQELGDGGDMYDYIMRYDGGLGEEMSRRYFFQIASAIQYCHQLHVVHRDLKPENVVFFERLQCVKLTDFGFSNKYEPNQKLQTSCGSLAYSAPEILLGDEYDAPAVDIWSLGVLLYMFVCGEAPFNEATDSETLTMIMDCKYLLPDHLSDDCVNLIESMIVRDADDRITLENIIQHRWLSNLILPQTQEPLVERGSVPPDVHNDVLECMVKGAVADKESIINSLEHQAYDHIAATYYLLAERKMRIQNEERKRQGLLKSHNRKVIPRLQHSSRSTEDMLTKEPGSVSDRRYSTGDRHSEGEGVTVRGVPEREHLTINPSYNRNIVKEGVGRLEQEEELHKEAMKTEQLENDIPKMLIVPDSVLKKVGRGRMSEPRLCESIVEEDCESELDDFEADGPTPGLRKFRKHRRRLSTGSSPENVRNEPNIAMRVVRSYHGSDVSDEEDNRLRSARDSDRSLGKRQFGSFYDEGNASVLANMEKNDFTTGPPASCGSTPNNRRKHKKTSNHHLSETIKMSNLSVSSLASSVSSVSKYPIDPTNQTPSEGDSDSLLSVSSRKTSYNRLPAVSEMKSFGRDSIIEEKSYCTASNIPDDDDPNDNKDDHSLKGKSNVVSQYNQLDTCSEASSIKKHSMFSCPVPFRRKSNKSKNVEDSNFCCKLL